MSPKLCSVVGCDRQAHARGWCDAHYQRVWKKGDLLPDMPIRGPGRPVCAIDDCDYGSVAHGLCKKHYSRWRVHGDPTVVVGNGGERNGLWKGDEASDGSVHERARRLYPLGQCEFEGCDAPAKDRHHVDGNPWNNAASNVLGLCRRHHMQLDGRLARMRERNAQTSIRERDAKGRIVRGGIAIG